MLVVQMCFAASVHAAGKITWSDVKKGTYENLHPHTLNWSGDVMRDGGLNLSTMKVTKKGSEADIVINQYGSMGANGILELDEDLEDPTDSDLYGFTNSVTIKKGAVYLVILHDGTFAKIRIDRFTPENGLSISKVFFSYVLEEYEEEYDDYEDYDTGTGTGTTSGSAGSAIDLDLGDPLDWDEVESVYEFEEGEIYLPWNALPGHASWDLFRSDNGEPWVKMTDFRLTVPEFTDKYVFAGHTYIYKFAAYNSRGEVVYISPPVVVTIYGPGELQEEFYGDVIVMQLNNKSASVNGKPVTLDVAPFLQDGRTLVPLRFVSEALGAEVKWNDKEKSITLIRGSDTMKLTINRSDAIVNGKTIYMDVPAINHKGTTMVPIRFVVENFQLEIEFDNATGTITIYSGYVGEEADVPADEPAEEPSKQPANDPATGPSGGADDLSYFYGEWAMWIPGTGISTPDGGGKYVPGVDAGTLTIYKNGTYDYPWNGDIVTGYWDTTSSPDQIILYNYKFGYDWTVTRTDSGITVSDPPLREVGTDRKSVV